jgi:hypothetical protein
LSASVPIYGTTVLLSVTAINPTAAPYSGRVAADPAEGLSPPLRDILAHKHEMDRQRLQALDELAAQAQELDLGY